MRCMRSSRDPARDDGPGPVVREDYRLQVQNVTLMVILRKYWIAMSLSMDRMCKKQGALATAGRKHEFEANKTDVLEARLGSTLTFIYLELL